MKTAGLKTIVIPAAPLGVGGLIYILWRSPSLLMFKWFDALGLTTLLMSMRSACSDVRSNIPDWVLYSLPDAAWLSSGFLLYAVIWSGSRCGARHFWVWVPPFLAVTGEFGQLFRVVPGTFDVTDVMVCIGAAAASYLVSRRLLNYVH